MMSVVLSIIPVALTFYLCMATVYLLGLALAYLVLPEPSSGPAEPLNRFAILVPAHNEELLVGNLCESLLRIDYPEDLYEIFVIADNCSDRTVEVCKKYPIQVRERYSQKPGGKGQALAWGLGQIKLASFDAVFIVDADSYVSPNILRELSRMLNGCDRAIQCYNGVGNRDDSWFTQLLYVSRLIGNELYHGAKYRIGLSSYLMGNGLCFKSELLERKGWTAFTTAEDWEFYVQLVEENVKIAFAAKAKVFHQEARSLNQATSQRLRWSSGRFHIARTLGCRLLVQGFRERNWLKIDGSLPLLFPNYSLLVNLSCLTLALAFLLPTSVAKEILIAMGLGMLAGQMVLFLAGALLAGSPGKIFIAIMHVPLFLIWKLGIDVLCISGLNKEKRWVRTARHRPEKMEEF